MAVMTPRASFGGWVARVATQLVSADYGLRDAGASSGLRQLQDDAHVRTPPAIGTCQCPSMQRYPKKIALQVGLGKNECRRVGPRQQRTVLDHSCTWKFGCRGRHVDSGHW